MGTPWLSMDPRANTFVEIARPLSLSPVFFVVSDARPASSMFSAAASRELISFIVAHNLARRRRGGRRRLTPAPNAGA